MKELIQLKKLTKDNTSKNYINWLKDESTIRYTQQNFSKPTKKKLAIFIKENKKNDDIKFYGIFLNSKHVGNIRLGPIIKNHKTAYIGYLISKENSGKGIATLAINKTCEMAFKKFGIKKINAATMELNISSQKCLLNNKFKKEGVLKKQLIYKNKRYDEYYYGLSQKDFKKKISFKNLC